MSAIAAAIVLLAMSFPDLSGEKYSEQAKNLALGIVSIWFVFTTFLIIKEATK